MMLTLQDFRPICRDPSYKTKVQDAIARTFEFYRTHEEGLAEGDHVIGLVFLKG